MDLDPGRLRAPDVCGLPRRVRHAGAAGASAPFAEIAVTLGPGWSHAEIAEAYAMDPGDRWDLDLSRGWRPTRGIAKPFGGGAGSGLVGGKVESERPLKPGGLPYQRPDLFINLFPRWNQHYKDGWAFAATDGEIDLDRSQGDIGLFVPDAGYPFGRIPGWLVRQRAGRAKAR